MDRHAPDLRALAGRFDLPGDFLRASPLGEGHIHDTFLVVTRDAAGERRAVLQRLNERVFFDVAGLMANVGRVTRHLQARLEAAGAADAQRRALALVPARDGEDWLRDDEGGAWRAFRYVPGAVARGAVATPAEARAVAAAFGAFQRQLADLPGPPLREHLPGFHDGRARLAALHVALAVDRRARVKGAREEIAQALAQAHLAEVFPALESRGARPGPVHNDTKPDNLLRDEATGEPLCVIDLDTVMPGWRLADFGDLARAVCGRVPEDERDLARVAADPELFAGLAGGFLAAAGGLLSDAEREALPDAAMALAWEQGVRFLADWLDGDVYYPARRPEHNLERCRAQFALLRSFAAQADDLRERVARLAAGEAPA